MTVICSGGYGVHYFIICTFGESFGGIGVSLVLEYFGVKSTHREMSEYL